MGFEIWLICDRCRSREPVDVRTWTGIWEFTMDATKRIDDANAAGIDFATPCTLLCPACAGRSPGRPGDKRIASREGTS